MHASQVEIARDAVLGQTDARVSSGQGYWVKNRNRAYRDYHKHIAVFWKVMQRYSPKIDEERFLGETERRFEELLPKLPLHPGSRKQLFNDLMPVLGTFAAAFLVLREHGYGVDQIGRIAYEGYVEFFGKMPGPARLVMRSFMVSSLFRSFMRPACEKMTASGRADTFFIDYSFQKKPCRMTNMTCRQCAMITFMERNDLEEMKRLCNVFDFAQAKALGLGLRQPSCIGAGDDVCRYVFTRDGNDTVLPPNLAAIVSTPMDV